MTRFVVTLSLMLTFALPVQAQIVDIGSIDLSNTNDINIDRFGKPVFGLRAQREPEMRRLRKQAGRPVLQGVVELYDVDINRLESAFNKNGRGGKSPDVKCEEMAGEIICKAE